MESHPLNLAHQQHRRADALLVNNRYDEAMQCHHNAAELLLDAMKSTTSSVALESITLQHSYHLKQKDLIKCKKEQYARVKKAMDNIKLLSKDMTLTLDSKDQSQLQVAIYRAINETDSLLHILSTYDNDSSKKEQSDGVSIDITDGKKLDKSPKIVVEELQILSQNLHSLVEQLVLQVEVLKDENVTLKERVSYLEKERVKYLNLPGHSEENHNFTTINSPLYGNEPIPRAPITAVLQLNKPPSNMTSERSTQKAHFDLSAFKDD